MDTVNESKAQPGRNQSAADVPPSSSRIQLAQLIEAQRMRLLQAHGVLICLYEVLLHAEGEDAITYAEAAHAVVHLIDDSLEELDSLRIGPLIDAQLR